MCNFDSYFGFVEKVVIGGYKVNEIIEEILNIVIVVDNDLVFGMICW